jgi:hypothetical protein
MVEDCCPRKTLKWGYKAEKREGYLGSEPQELIIFRNIYSLVGSSWVESAAGYAVLSGTHIEI